MNWDLSLPMNPTMSEYAEVSKDSLRGHRPAGYLHNGQLR